MRIRVSKTKFGIVFILVCLVCVTQVNYAISQTELPNPIHLGIRTAAFPIGNITTDGEWGGFCGVFAQKLSLRVKSQQISVLPKNIENEYRGKGYPRFDGLLSNTIDVECGPNSISSLDLPDKNGKPFRETIDFSNNSFFTTGIRLLIKAKDAQKLANSSSDNLIEKLSRLEIGVVPNTTTYVQLESRKEFYPNYQVIDAKDEKGDARDVALDALENGDIDALASDAIILQTLLEKGVRGEGSYRKTREPYGERGYAVFPSNAGEYLPYLSKEKYGIAIQKNPTQYSARALKELIDTVLNQPDLDRDEREHLAQSEAGQSGWGKSFFWIPLSIIGLGAAIAAFLKFRLHKLERNTRLKAEALEREDATSGNRRITANNYYENINTGGGSYTQYHYAEMSQDLAQAASQIQALLDRLTQQGVAANVAQEQVATDIAAEAQKNQTMKEKLFQWGASLASATVSDVIKGVVKLACNSAGIPL